LAHCVYSHFTQQETASVWQSAVVSVSVHRDWMKLMVRYSQTSFQIKK